MKDLNEAFSVLAEALTYEDAVLAAKRAQYRASLAIAASLFNLVIVVTLLLVVL